MTLHISKLRTQRPRRKGYGAAFAGLILVVLVALGVQELSRFALRPSKAAVRATVGIPFQSDGELENDNSNKVQAVQHLNSQ